MTKRLLSSDSPIFAPVTSPLLPPSDTAAADEAAAAYEAEIQSREDQRKQWREEVLLDFAAFESNIIRVQFLLDANVRERERYAAEKLRIQETAQEVRDNNMQLREQLKGAQKTMEIRKGYDAMADRITSNKALKPRDEQHAAIEKLHAEIADLEIESAEYSKTWAERREQFGRIVEEGMQMLRLIRDEKEEAERKEGMDEMDDDTETSKTGTPRPLPDGATPLHPGADSEPGSGFQRVAEQALGVTPLSTKRSRASSAAAEREESTAGDAAMTDAEAAADRGNAEEQTDTEEGEATEHHEGSTDKMDTT